MGGGEERWPPILLPLLRRHFLLHTLPSPPRLSTSTVVPPVSLPSAAVARPFARLFFIANYPTTKQHLKWQFHRGQVQLIDRCCLCLRHARRPSSGPPRVSESGHSTTSMNRRLASKWVLCCNPFTQFLASFCHFESTAIWVLMEVTVRFSFQSIQLILVAVMRYIGFPVYWFEEFYVKVCRFGEEWWMVLIHLIEKDFNFVFGNRNE